MGLSHLAIANMHPDVEVAGACDSNSYLTGVLNKYSGLQCYARMEDMLERASLDAVLISTPSRLHAPMVQAALERKLDVFCEKPFVLDPADGERLVEMAEQRNVVTQVGYHCRFVAAFEKAAALIASGALGVVHHIRAEAYGPVVVRQKGSTWRSTRAEGGGALYDYACHAIDLVHYMVGAPVSVDGVVRNSLFSSDVEDEIYCSMRFDNGASGQLAVNWSDDSFRKMSTKISVWGSNGRLTADRQECQVHLREPHGETNAGWSVFYTTDLTPEVWFYLRGEEYSAQLDYFAQSIKTRRTDGKNTFASALQTDRMVALLAGQGEPTARLTSDGRRKAGVFARLLGARA